MGALFSTPTASSPITDIKSEIQLTRIRIVTEPENTLTGDFSEIVILPTDAAHSRKHLLAFISKLPIMERLPDHELDNDSITILWSGLSGWDNSAYVTVDGDAQLGLCMDTAWTLKKRTVVQMKAVLKDTHDRAKGHDVSTKSEDDVVSVAGEREEAAGGEPAEGRYEAESHVHQEKAESNHSVHAHHPRKQLHEPKLLRGDHLSQTPTSGVHGIWHVETHVNGQVSRALGKNMSSGSSTGATDPAVLNTTLTASLSASKPTTSSMVQTSTAENGIVERLQFEGLQEELQVRLDSSLSFHGTSSTSKAPSSNAHPSSMPSTANIGPTASGELSEDLTSQQEEHGEPEELGHASEDNPITNDEGVNGESTHEIYFSSESRTKDPKKIVGHVDNEEEL